MEGKINEKGNLFIKRGKTIKKQTCSHARGANSIDTWSTCSDKCPLFGEPESNISKTKIKLDLCTRTLLFDKFEDERPKQ